LAALLRELRNQHRLVVRIFLHYFYSNFTSLLF
jgi:hypothetical protein